MRSLRQTERHTSRQPMGLGWAADSVVEPSGPRGPPQPPMVPPLKVPKSPRMRKYFGRRRGRSERAGWGKGCVILAEGWSGVHISQQGLMMELAPPCHCMRGHSLFPLSLPPPVMQIIKQRSSPSTKTFDGPVVTRRSPTGAAAQPLLAHLSSNGTGPRPGPGHSWSVL